MTDALTTGLAQVSALSVIARTSTLRYEGTQKTTPEIARELHVDAVVEGSVQRSGDRVRITAELVDGSNDHQLWAKSYERDARDALGLQNEVAQAIAGEIQVKLTPQEQARLAPPRPVNPEAQEAYLRGIYWREKGDDRRVSSTFNRPSRKTPATRALGRRFGSLRNDVRPGLISSKEARPKERAAANRALELDNTSAEAHMALGAILQYHDWNFAEVDRGIPPGHRIKSQFRAWLTPLWLRGLTVQGKVEEALAEFRRALELAPFDAIVNYGMTDRPVLGATL